MGAYILRELGPLGAVAVGFDLRRIGAADVLEIQRLLAYYGVLFFEEDPFDLDALRTLGEKFGPLHVHPHYHAISGTHPEVIELDSDVYGRDPVGWHTDATFETFPPAYTILQCIRPARTGGQTLFASTRLAYESLHPLHRAMLAPLRVLHDSAKAFADRAPEPTVFRSEASTSAAHPLVLSHPLTGCRSLYLNPNYAVRVLCLPVALGRKLLLARTQHATQSRFTIGWDWKRGGTVAIWDNRVTMHSVRGGFEGRRIMRRVVALGPATRLRRLGRSTDLLPLAPVRETR
jgi:taurine dioxygenase